MPEINLIDPSLKKYKENIELSIQVSLDGFSFCIHTSGDEIRRAVRHYKFPRAVLQEDIFNHTDEVLQKDDLLRLPYQKVRVCFLNRKSTIVPEEYTDSNAFKKILQFNQPIDELDEIHHNSVHSCNAKLIFAVPSYFAGLITDKFNEVQFIHQAAPLLRYSMEESIPNKELISIQLNKDFFDIVIIRDGKLKLYNSFLYVNSTDLLYFILYACKQLDIELKNTPILITGEQASNMALIKELRPYLSRQMSLRKPENSILSDSLAKLDQSRFFTLLNLLQCE